MRRQGVWSAVVASASVVACAAMGPTGGSDMRLAHVRDQVCHGGGTSVCQIDVNCSGTVCEVDPKVLLIDGGVPRQKLMISLKTTSGYSFASDAIAFPSGSGWDCRVNGTREIKCDAGQYAKGAIIEYALNVSPSSGPAIKADPWVVNN